MKMILLFLSAAVLATSALAHPEHATAKKASVGVSSPVEFKGKPLDLKLSDLDGREIDLSKYRGKVVLLDFWAAWCAPCIKQMPHLVEVYGKYHARGLEVIGVTCDTLPKDPAKPTGREKTLPMMKEFVAKHGIPWPQIWNTHGGKPDQPTSLSGQFGVRNIPAYLLFDRNGIFVTADLKGEKLEAEIRRLLGHE